MYRIFRFTREQMQFIIYIWGNLYTSKTTLTNVYIYKKISQLFISKFNIYITHTQVEKKIIYEKSTYTALKKYLKNTGNTRLTHGAPTCTYFDEIDTFLGDHMKFELDNVDSSLKSEINPETAEICNFPDDDDPCCEDFKLSPDVDKQHSSSDFRVNTQTDDDLASTTATAQASASTTTTLVSTTTLPTTTSLPTTTALPTTTSLANMHMVEPALLPLQTSYSSVGQSRSLALIGSQQQLQHPSSSSSPPPPPHPLSLANQADSKHYRPLSSPSSIAGSINYATSGFRRGVSMSKTDPGRDFYVANGMAGHAQRKRKRKSSQFNVDEVGGGAGVNEAGGEIKLPNERLQFVSFDQQMPYGGQGAVSSADTHGQLAATSGGCRVGELAKLEADVEPLRIKLEPADHDICSPFATADHGMNHHDESSRLLDAAEPFDGDNREFGVGGAPSRATTANGRGFNSLSMTQVKNAGENGIAPLDAAEIIRQLSQMNNRIHSIHDLTIINKHNIDKIMDHLNNLR